MTEFPDTKDEHYLGLTFDDIELVEPKIGKRHKLSRHFGPLASLLPTHVTAAMSRGTLPIVSFKPQWGWHGTKVSHSRVADGEIDGWLETQRDAVVGRGDPIVLCYTPEPETLDESADFGGGIAREQLGAEYGRAWRHILDVFGEHDHIRWVCCFAGGMIQYPWVQKYWPDDQRVAYVGSDPYNWCDYEGRTPGVRPFADIVKPTVDFSRSVKKPVLLLECASWFKPDDAAFRANWIRAMGDHLAERPRIKGVCWFENNTNCDWRLSQQRESLDAWGELLERFGHL